MEQLCLSSILKKTCLCLDTFLKLCLEVCRSFMATMRFFIYRFIQGGSRSSQVINSLGTKLDIMFIIVSLKTETCSLTSRLLNEVSQANRLMDFFYMIRICPGEMPVSSFIRRRVINLQIEFSINYLMVTIII